MFILFELIYWLWLELEANTCAEMPQVKEYKRQLAKKHKPF